MKMKPIKLQGTSQEVDDLLAELAKSNPMEAAYQAAERVIECVSNIQEVCLASDETWEVMPVCDDSGDLGDLDLF